MIYTALLAIALGASSLASKAQVAQATVANATLDSSGAIHISYSDGSDVTAPKLKDQVGFGHPIVARDKRTVGWLAMFPFCCTSYPIPLTLAIYRDGKILESISPGRCIFHWIFLLGGSRVALRTEFLHGESHPDYELHDVNSGRLLARWNPSSSKKQPEWVGLLESDNSNNL